MAEENVELARKGIAAKAFERPADPEAIPDEVFAEFITAVLGCGISAPHSP
jgi:hypothetical protein